MLENNSIVVYAHQKPIGVQILIEEFELMEEVSENYGLAKLMDEVAAVMNSFLYRRLSHLQ